MKERVEYGSLCHLTDEEYRQRKAETAKQWRKDHADKVKAYNHKWYELNRLHPKHRIKCKYCGAWFKSYRKTAKMCPDCVALYNKPFDKNKYK